MQSSNPTLNIVLFKKLSFSPRLKRSLRGQEPGSHSLLPSQSLPSTLRSTCLVTSEFFQQIPVTTESASGIGSTTDFKRKLQEKGMLSS